jgi:ProP effector
MEKNRNLHRAIALRVRFDLAEKFPLCFARKGCPKKPLKVGIFGDLRTAWPELQYFSLKLGLADYCAGPSYQAALMVAGAWRYDLEGNRCDVVTEEQATRAREIFMQWPEHVRARFMSVAA